MALGACSAERYFINPPSLQAGARRGTRNGLGQIMNPPSLQALARRGHPRVGPLGPAPPAGLLQCCKRRRRWRRARLALKRSRAHAGAGRARGRQLAKGGSRAP